MVLARDDFEEQCNFVDVEVPDVECQEVEINNSPCPLFVADYGVFKSKSVNRLPAPRAWETPLGPGNIG